MLTSCWQDWDGIPGDEQQTCSKHVEAYYWNRLIENHASCWFIVYGYNRDYILSQSKHHIPWIIIFFPAMKILEAHLTLNKVMINLWATKNESCFRELQADKKLYPSFSSSLFVRHEQVTYLHGRKISKHLRHFTTHSHSTPFYHTLTLTHTLLHFITHSPWLTLYFILSHTHPDSHSTSFYHTLTLTHTLLHFTTHSPWLTLYSILSHTHPDSHSTPFYHTLTLTHTLLHLPQTQPCGLLYYFNIQPSQLRNWQNSTFAFRHSCQHIDLALRIFFILFITVFRVP